MNKSPILRRLLSAFKKTQEKSTTRTNNNSEYPPDLERHYKITKKVLGKGSFAIVKECIHRHTGQSFALKIILKKAIAGKENMLHSELGKEEQTTKGNPNEYELYTFFV
ncbi:unnamed protein product [Absidia cylindrospora]